MKKPLARRRLAAKYGIWADPWHRPKTWDEAAAKLAIEITKVKSQARDARLAALKKRKD